MSDDIYGIEVETIDGKQQDLSAYRGKVMLIVNTASQCGFTPQYDGLEALWKRLGPRGLVVLGFPCNQFGAQEPGGTEEIATFCRKNHGVTFPLHAKVDVNGPTAHPLYKHLKKAAPGLFGTEGVKWNFTKFLVDKQGQVVDRFAPTTTPEALAPKVEALL